MIFFAGKVEGTQSTAARNCAVAKYIFCSSQILAKFNFYFTSYYKEYSQKESYRKKRHLSVCLNVVSRHWWKNSWLGSVNWCFQSKEKSFLLWLSISKQKSAKKNLRISASALSIRRYHFLIVIVSMSEEIILALTQHAQVKISW